MVSPLNGNSPDPWIAEKYAALLAQQARAPANASAVPPEPEPYLANTGHAPVVQGNVGIAAMELAKFAAAALSATGAAAYWNAHKEELAHSAHQAVQVTKQWAVDTIHTAEQWVQGDAAGADHPLAGAQISASRKDGGDEAARKSADEAARKAALAELEAARQAQKEIEEALKKKLN